MTSPRAFFGLVLLDGALSRVLDMGCFGSHAVPVVAVRVLDHLTAHLGVCDVHTFTKSRLRCHVAVSITLSAVVWITRRAVMLVLVLEHSIELHRISY